MSFVEESCFHCPYTEEVAKECHEFHCGEADLDDFFSKDASEVLSFYRKNGFETLFTSEQQEDFYVNPPKDEEQRLMRLANPTQLATRLMFTDLLKD